MMSPRVRPVGLFAWFGFPMPLEDRLRHIAATGFDTTALWLGDEEPHVRSGTIDDVPRIARDYGLAIDNAHAPFNHCTDLWSASAAARDEFVDAMRRCVDFCARHTIPIVVIHVSRGSSPPAVTESGMAALAALVGHSHDANVILAVENTARPDHLEHVLREIDCPSLGFCYDSSHDFLVAGRPCELLERWGHRLVATHFSDNGGVLDNHWLPGEGTIDWRRVQRAFPRPTYQGTILLETVARAGAHASAESFLAEALRRAHDLRTLLAPSTPSALSTLSDT